MKNVTEKSTTSLVTCNFLFLIIFLAFAPLIYTLIPFRIYRSPQKVGTLNLSDCFFKRKGGTKYMVTNAVSNNKRKSRKLEMFAREKRNYWDVWGNEA